MPPTPNALNRSAIFKLLIVIKTRTLRSSNSNLLARPSGITINFSSRAFSVSAPSTWNSLHAHIRCLDKLSTYKRQLSWICLGHIWTIHEEYFVVSRIVQNLVVIDEKVYSRHQNFAFFFGELTSKWVEKSTKSLKGTFLRETPSSELASVNIRRFASIVCEFPKKGINKTRGSAMAEGPRDAVVSRNSVTTKHPI